MTSDLEKYRNNLFEIRKRTDVISDHLAGFRTTKYLITEVEFLCLQFRKILELIALSSLIANKKEYSEQHSKFAKHYNARLIIQDLERVNPDFYPRPTKQIIKTINSKPVFQLESVKDGYLTKEEFIRIYEICGGMLHADNPYAQKKDATKLKNLFPTWINKIITLLNHHNLTLLDGNMIVGLMKGKEDGNPQATLFQVADDDESRDILSKLRP